MCRTLLVESLVSCKQNQTSACCACCLHTLACRGGPWWPGLPGRLIGSSRISWLPVLGLPVQLVACAWLDCLYNWLLRLYRQRKRRQPVIHADKAQATSYTGNPAKHSPPVAQAAQAQATSYTSSASTGNQLYRQRKHRQPVIHAAQAQATSYTGSASYIGNASTGNQLYTQRQHRQPVIQAAPAIQATQSQATSYTASAITDKR